MNKRQFLKGMAATAAGILVPGHVLSGQYEFHQRVSGLRAGSSASPGPTMKDATPEERTGVMSTGVPLAEDAGVVWYGEVSSVDLISGNDLASLIGLTNGTPINSNGGWLHVGLDGTELLIAKRPFRHSASWSNLNASSVNAVYGSKTVSIRDSEYRVRLMRGANVDPVPVTGGYDIPITHGSEWNRIFYRLTNQIYSDFRNTKESEGDFINLAFYSESDLVMGGNSGQGFYTWCQENSGSNQFGSLRTARGYQGVSSIGTGFNGSQNNTVNFGWRPVLEKI